tara:strand:- start:1119 stop:1727 length:609 start_codon:yes stop_codon:yes gene_type:complete
MSARQALVASITLVMVLGLSLLILVQPASHILKHLLSSEDRYDPWKVKNEVLPRLRPGESIFASPDNYLLPFLRYLKDTYRETSEHQTYWVLPYLVGGHDLEEKAVNSFLCYLSKEGENGIVWALFKPKLISNDQANGFAEIELGFWRQFGVVFSYSDVLYEAHDSLFLRGFVEAVYETRNSEGAVTRRLLFQRGVPLADCL